ncbi:MAG TPA: hypothetical protein VHN15_05185, partial [Thermoanaerobaculia bacterium]|nr:hypothetical protein [Thermoanaerobaculia bacterium]
MPPSSSWQRETGGRRALRLLGDVAAALLAFSGAFLARIHLPLPFTESLLPPDRLFYLGREWAAVLLAQLAALYFLGLYDPPRPRSRFELARQLAVAAVFQGMLLTGYYFLADRPFPRSVLLLYLILAAVLLFAWRVLLDR